MNSHSTTFALPARREHYYGGAWHAIAVRSASPAWRIPRRAKASARQATAARQDVDRAVTAAASAFAGWRDTPAQQRARMHPRAVAALLREHREELAWLDAVDTGNPLQAMLYDVEISAAYMDYFAGLVTEIKGARSRSSRACSTTRCASRSASSRESARSTIRCCSSRASAGAPLAAGNTLIVKPAEQTPLTALRIAELWASVFPPGRVQRGDRRTRRGRCAGRASARREDRLHRQRQRRPRGDARRRAPR